MLESFFMRSFEEGSVNIVLRGSYVVKRENIARIAKLS